MKALLVAALVFASVAHASMGDNASYLADVPYPGRRPPSSDEVELGRRLFFDVRLSSTDTVACATCHRQEHGFADPRRFSVGVAGTPLKRHTPHLQNLAWAHTLFWDGRASSLEEQAVAPIRNPEEMGLPGDKAAAKLKALPEYAAAFERTFGSSAITMKKIARAIASFERTLVSKDSPFDRHEAGDATAMEPAAVRGKELFFGRAKCATCHGGPNFTDGLFHNTGVMGDDPGRAALDRVGEFQMRPYPFFQMRRAFKTPGLRNVALTAPYQHDGSEATLIDVVRFYNLGGRDPESYGRALDIRPLGLQEDELGDLVAFLNALTAPIELPSH